MSLLTAKDRFIDIKENLILEFIDPGEILREIKTLNFKKYSVDFGPIFKGEETWLTIHIRLISGRKKEKIIYSQTLAHVEWDADDNIEIIKYESGTWDYELNSIIDFKNISYLRSLS